MQVELLHGDAVLDSMNFASQELLEFKDSAIAAITERAALGGPVERLQYRDDEGDWCSLNKDTLADALEFAVLVPAPAGCGMDTISKLQVRVRSSASVEVPREAPVSWEQLALKELNELASDVDLRQLVPKLAGRFLKVIEETQQPAMFPIIERLIDLHEGKIKAEDLPAVLPQFAQVAAEVPEEAAGDILERLRQEAAEAVKELREEATSSGRRLEVHVHVTCDGCSAFPLIGKRYKSLECENYDLCQACFEGERVSRCWARVRSGVYYDGVVSSYYAAPAAGPAGQSVHYRIQCDGCEVFPIVGRRFRCLDLEDYDLCEACHERSAADPATAGRRFEETPTIVVEGAALAAFEVAEATVEETVPDIAAAAADMDEGALKAALAELLGHSDPAVRAAAAGAVLRARRADEVQLQEAPVTETAEVAEVPEVAKATEVPEVAEATPVVEGTEVAEKGEEGWDFVETAARPAASGPSASVIQCAPLLVGIEAQEDDAARGDVSADFAPILEAAGARQAFRTGRVVAVAGEDAVPVPACTKLVVLNDGQVPWPETTALSLAAGETFDFQHLALGSIQPGEAAEIVMDLLVPARAEPGTSRSTWALLDTATGALLGPLLIFEVIWVAA